MRKVIMASVVAIMCLGFTAQAMSALYVEYYRDNLFVGLAYHRIGCLTDWNSIQSSQDYDGFTNTRYCYAGASANSVPGGEWYDWNYASSKAQLDACGSQTNNRYDTPNYAARSNSCSYNILTDCNSDCWIRAFSECQGKRVGIASPCW
ncbi:hypothetical protein [Haliangium ochraceum]|uniref:Secreted protein n=1 Tax=Haliangium ochraceum (strain DSM 14365 / JCM 11303 / SMP-2) TaxID=502025 RepID=D0LUD5_HALO1|nr:hypothetical protein [Haliangium ochraceum]ACY19258.1 hypothetical protein Hoch_6794 [Haliangium ochraceum DSM 14365]